jgi:hypothetical protein
VMYIYYRYDLPALTLRKTPHSAHKVQGVCYLEISFYISGDVNHICCINSNLGSTKTAEFNYKKIYNIKVDIN